VIHLVDTLVAKPGRVDELRDLLLRRYLPGARARGMSLLSEWVAPGVEPDAQAREWVLLWGVADVAAWWSMRAQAGSDPQVESFWRDADLWLERRRRRMLAPRSGEPGEAPARTRLGPETWRSQRATALVSLAPGVGEAARTRFEAVANALPRCVPGCLRSALGRNLPGTVNGGDYTLDLLFDDSERAASWLDAAWSDPASRADWDAAVSSIDAVHYAPLEGGLDAPRIASPLKRTLLLRVEPWAPAGQVLRFERELAAMPDHIPAIRNWHLARVPSAVRSHRLEPGPQRAPRKQGGKAAAQRGAAERSKSGWTHVWAQEFETLEGLQADYMLHPYHWATVDRWFDPESGERIVATELAHVFCTLSGSVLAWT
jgi:hypothetical protein